MHSSGSYLLLRFFAPIINKQLPLRFISSILADTVPSLVKSIPRGKKQALSRDSRRGGVKIGNRIFAPETS